MERAPSDAPSRDLIRAVLETRDRKHAESHAALLAIIQSVVAELVEQGALSAAPLAERLTRMDATISPDPHGEAAHSMLAHVIGWLKSMEPGLPPSHPERWMVPTPHVIEEG